MTDAARFVYRRTCCVYCGRRLYSTLRFRRDHVEVDRAPHPLACTRHVGLLEHDPVYATDLGEQ